MIVPRGGGGSPSSEPAGVRLPVDGGGWPAFSRLDYRGPFATLVDAELRHRVLRSCKVLITNGLHRQSFDQHGVASLCGDTWLKKCDAVS